MCEGHNIMAYKILSKITYVLGKLPGLAAI